MKEELSHHFDKLAKPAQRALANAGISTLEQLTELTEDEVMLLHGIGKNALRIIRSAMLENQLWFNQDIALFV
ncbi:MAG: hypothetical protein ACXVB0_07390 [Mucilaginibacter sp.]